MATDAAILTAARSYAAAVQALKDAEAKLAVLQSEVTRAGQAVDDKRKHASECQRHLLQIGSQKPSEPAPPAVVPQAVSQTPVKVAEPSRPSGPGNFPGPDLKPVPEAPREAAQPAPEPPPVVARPAVPSSVPNLGGRRRDRV